MSALPANPKPSANKGRPHPEGLHLTAATGIPVPVSGWWRPDEDPAPFRYLKQGQITPRLGGKKTVWTLVFALPPADRAKVKQKH